jgi:hypothetical protein
MRQRVKQSRLKDADEKRDALGLGIVSAGVWLQGSARGRTLVAPPLSLAPPSTEQEPAP